MLRPRPAAHRDCQLAGTAPALRRARRISPILAREPHQRGARQFGRHPYCRARNEARSGSLCSTRVECERHTASDRDLGVVNPSQLPRGGARVDHSESEDKHGDTEDIPGNFESRKPPEGARRRDPGRAAVSARSRSPGHLDIEEGGRPTWRHRRFQRRHRHDWSAHLLKVWFLRARLLRPVFRTFGSSCSANSRYRNVARMPHRTMARFTPGVASESDEARRTVRRCST